MRGLACVVMVLAVGVPTGFGASMKVLKHRQQRQELSLHRWQGTVRFFKRHPRLAVTRIGRREVRRAKVWLPILHRELAETKAGLRPRNPWTPGWFRQALCIHSREGAWSSNTGNGYEGGMQFLRSTWESVGGRSYGAHWASVASPREQLLRAWLVWKRDGGSWAEWGTAGMCGL